LQSKKRLDKLYRLKKRLVPTSPSTPNKEFVSSLLEAMSDDLNVSKALSIIDEMVANANDELDKNPKNKALKKENLANIEYINKLLGFGGMDAFEYFQIGIDDELKAKIEDMLEQRSQAKKAKDFATSDAIRDELIAMGISIMDTPQGTLWEKA
jgi:cysteinyl-tRNA synthetase